MQARERGDQNRYLSSSTIGAAEAAISANWALSLAPFGQRIATLKKRGCHARAAAGTRRKRALLRARVGPRSGGIPSFSAAASEARSSAVSVESAATARPGVAIRFLGQLDHAGGRGCGLAARHWPQFRQIVVPIAGFVVGQRIEGVLPRPSAAQATCSVSCAQPVQ